MYFHTPQSERLTTKSAVGSCGTSSIQKKNNSPKQNIPNLGEEVQKILLVLTSEKGKNFEHSIVNIEPQVFYNDEPIQSSIPRSDIEEFLKGEEIGVSHIHIFQQ